MAFRDVIFARGLEVDLCERATALSSWLWLGDRDFGTFLIGTRQLERQPIGRRLLVQLSNSTKALTPKLLPSCRASSCAYRVAATSKLCWSRLRDNCAVTWCVLRDSAVSWYAVNLHPRLQAIGNSLTSTISMANECHEQK